MCCKINIFVLKIFYLLVFFYRCFIFENSTILNIENSIVGLSFSSEESQIHFLPRFDLALCLISMEGGLQNATLLWTLPEACAILF